MKQIFLVVALTLLLLPSHLRGQSPNLQEKQGIYAIVKDGQGETIEGYLRFSTDEITVHSQENQEKTIPVKYIKSITLEKTKDGIPGEEMHKPAKYSVHLENSQEIYTLRNKYSFSLNTNLGLVTKTIDPEQINQLFSKEVSPSPKPESQTPFVQDKSIVFSLEFKF